MNKTATQLYDQYAGKLLWITLSNRQVIIGQFIGFSSPNEPRDITVWRVGKVSNYFSDKGNVPTSPNPNIRPSEIVDIAILDWNETGGAKQLKDLCNGKWIAIKKVSGEHLFGAITEIFVPKTAYVPSEEGVYIVGLETPEVYNRFIQHTGIRAIRDLRLVYLSEIATIEVLHILPEEPSD